MDCRLADHPKVHVGVFWPSVDRLVLIESTGSSILFSNELIFQPHLDSFAEKLMRNRSYFIKRDLEPIITKGLQSFGSILAVPIMNEEKTNGVLIFGSHEPAFFSERHLGRAQLLAALIAYTMLQLEPRIRLITPVSISVGQALKRVREEIGLTQAELAFRMNQSRIALSRWERGGQPPTRGPFYNWCEALKLLSPRESALVTLVDITPRLLEILKEDPSRLRQLLPEQFEQFVAERIDRMGFNVRLTGSTYHKDGGIDLIAVPKMPSICTFLFAGQIKHHRTDQKTGREAVDRLLSWKDSLFRIGLLVTNTGFTKDALWVASQDPNKAFLRLRDFYDLKRWVEDNFWSAEEWREIPDEVSLAPEVTIAVPKPKFKNLSDIWPLSEFHG